jgi:hypothetical protein
MSLVVMTKRGRGIRELHSAGGEKRRTDSAGQYVPLSQLFVQFKARSFI